VATGGDPGLPRAFRGACSAKRVRSGKPVETSAGHLRVVAGSESLQIRLEGELERLKGRLGAGHELAVVWSPSSDSKLSGEVKDGVIHIYEPEGDRAVEALRHEFIDHLVGQAIEPYRSVANKLIQLLNEAAYRKKEEVVEALAKLL